MKFDIYCDESYPDLLASKSPPAKFLVIGSLWLPRDRREQFKSALHELRDRYLVGGEFKWQKVSPSRSKFYQELVDWFFDCGELLRFRCVAIDHTEVNLIKYHENDQELGFYKFYYQLLHHWILDFNEYSVFCDFKTNRSPDRLHVLEQCLGRANLSSRITNVQALRSEESVLIQLSDVLTGLAAARLNNSLKPQAFKRILAEYLEKRLGSRLGPTNRDEQKFNVFSMRLEGGW